LQKETPLSSSSNNTFEIELDSFSNNISITYSLESLPLNDLFKDNSKLYSKKCDSQSKTRLNCLQSTIPIQFEYCNSVHSFNLSYGYQYFEEYSNVTDLKKLTFYQSISAKCRFYITKTLIKI
jgi:hypothetical protein